MALVVEAGTARRAQIDSTSAWPARRVRWRTRSSKDHAAFMAYAPIDNPQVAVGVIVENAGYCTTTAAPIASLMIQQYLKGYTTRPELIAGVRAQKSSTLPTPDD